MPQMTSVPSAVESISLSEHCRHTTKETGHSGHILCDHFVIFDSEKWLLITPCSHDEFYDTTLHVTTL